MNREPSERPAVGLLPLYLALYDELLPDLRDCFTGYLQRIRAGLGARNVAVRQAPICCVAAEIAAAVQQFEADGVDAIVTLHLAYSPSLEAIDTLCATALPIVMLDATMDAAFGVDAPAGRMMTNHGVHGVMDLASMLRRRGRACRIVAGHDSDPRTLDRVAEALRTAPAPSAAPRRSAASAVGCAAASRIAAALRSARVVRIGPSFAGMGDFVVEESLLEQKLGIGISHMGVDALDEAVRGVSDGEVARELARDRERFDCELPVEAHARAVRVGLGLRALLQEGGYDAFSLNFQAIDRVDRPACTMPFLEISKAMGRGIGYAGEGDVLTAALAGALARVFDQVTFTEIFCADWQGGNLFLSHMGEISPSVAGGRPRVFVKPLPFIGGHAPAMLTCAIKPGPAVFVNLAPGPGGTFSLIVAPVEVLAEDDSLDPAMRDAVRAWVKPHAGLVDFLETYSRAGGTHHSALVLGEPVDEIAAFGEICGMEVVRIPAAEGVVTE